MTRGGKEGLCRAGLQAECSCREQDHECARPVNPLPLTCRCHIELAADPSARKIAAGTACRAFPARGADFGAVDVAPCAMAAEGEVAEGGGPRITTGLCCPLWCSADSMQTDSQKVMAPKTDDAAEARRRKQEEAAAARAAAAAAAAERKARQEEAAAERRREAEQRAAERKALEAQQRAEAEERKRAAARAAAERKAAAAKAANQGKASPAPSRSLPAAKEEEEGSGGLFGGLFGSGPKVKTEKGTRAPPAPLARTGSGTQVRTPETPTDFDGASWPTKPRKSGLCLLAISLARHVWNSVLQTGSAAQRLRL